jgi:hypothetical protein
MVLKDPASSMECLPESLLGHILSYLTFSEAHGKFFSINHHFWFHLRPTLALTTLEVVVDRCDTKESFEFMAHTHQTSLVWKALSLYSNLQVLDLQSYATDMLLASIVANDFLPALTIIRMCRSNYLTDEGLVQLSRHDKSSSFPPPTTATATAATEEEEEEDAMEREGSTIQEIDITFCRNTTYQGTFVLRDKLPNLRLLRRQPAWLDGNFYTPFGNSNTEEEEVHTYWPDGTFSFNRASQSTGFVLSWDEWTIKGGGLTNSNSPAYLGNRLQFNNFAPGAWPVWSRYAYRPGVCLLELFEDGSTNHDDHDKNDNIDTASTKAKIKKEKEERYVLVGQRLKGLRAPNINLVMTEVAPHIPVGTSRYVDPITAQIYEEPDEERYRILVSKMKVLPLSSMMPPKELVEECRQTCIAMKDYGEDFLSQKEWELDELL